VETIIRVGILSGSSGEGSSPPLAAQLSFFSFCREEILSTSLSSNGRRYLGLLIADALAAWVPNSFWNAFFFSNNPTVSKIEDPLVGPLSRLSVLCALLAMCPWLPSCGEGGLALVVLSASSLPT
jgi:hypothetical protein